MPNECRVRHWSPECHGDGACSWPGPIRTGLGSTGQGRSGGEARLEQIQLSLGHPSITTTERYLGVEQDLTDALCDRLGLRLQAV